MVVVGREMEEGMVGWKGGIKEGKGESEERRGKIKLSFLRT